MEKERAPERVGKFVVSPFSFTGNRILFEVEGKRYPLNHFFIPDLERWTYRLRSKILSGGYDVLALPLSLVRDLPIEEELKEEIEVRYESLSPEERKRAGYVVVLTKAGWGERWIHFADGRLYPELDVEVGKSAGEQKRKQKVYETPAEVMKSLLYGAAAVVVRNLAQEFVYSQLLSFGAVRGIGHLRRIVEQNWGKDDVPGKAGAEKAKEIISKLVPDLFTFESTLKERGYNPEKFYELFVEAFNGKSLKRLVSLLKDLGINPEVPVVDWQAGTGKHAEYLKEFGIDSALFGLEIREAPENLPEGNRVIYGANFMEWLPAVKRTVGSHRARSAVYFLNPPYTQDRTIEIETVRCVPNYGMAVGVFPKSLMGLLENNFEGVAAVLPKEAVGYAESEAPEEFVVFIGRKNPNRPSLSYVKINNPKELASVVNLLFSVYADRYGLSGLDRYRIRDLVVSFSKATLKIADLSIQGIKPSEETEKFFASLTKEYSLLDSYRKFYQQEFRIAEDFSLVQRAVEGAPVFPDVRFFGSKPLKTFNQVVGDLSLLNLYRQEYPELYRFLEKVARIKKYTLPEIKENTRTEYVTSENLGIMKLRYYPRTVELTPEVEDVFLSFLSGKDREKVEPLIETLRAKGRSLRLTVRSTVGQFLTAGELEFGNTPVLALVDETGREYAGFRIPIAEFYSALEKQGIIDLSRKYRVVEPTPDEKEKIVTTFIQDTRNLAERYGIKVSPQDIKEFTEIWKEVNSGKTSVDKLTDWLAEKVKENNLFYRFQEDVTSPETAERLIYTALKRLSSSVEADIPAKEIAKTVAEAYSAKPHSFFTNRDRSDRFISETLNRLLRAENLKEEVKTTIWDAVGRHYAEHLKLVSAVGKLYLGIVMGEIVNRLKGEARWKAFEQYVMGLCGVKPHQFKEAVRTVAKVMRTGEKGHLLGWEMRSGKTLTMVLAGYFYRALTGKPVYLFPRTANLNDVIRQTVEFLPFISAGIVAYSSGDVSPVLSSHRVKTVIGDRESIFPNVYSVISRSRIEDVEKFVVGGGDAVRELLETYALEMEELINLARESGKGLDEIKEGNPFEFVKELEGYSEPVKVALYWYLNRKLREGRLNPDYLEQFKTALLKHGEGIQAQLEAEPSVPEGSYFFIVPKSKLKNLNYEIELDEKKLKLPYRKNDYTFVFKNSVELIPAESMPYGEKESEAVKDAVSLLVRAPEKENSFTLAGATTPEGITTALSEALSRILGSHVEPDEISDYLDYSVFPIGREFGRGRGANDHYYGVVITPKSLTDEQVKRLEEELARYRLFAYEKFVADRLVSGLFSQKQFEMQVELEGIPVLDDEGNVAIYSFKVKETLPQSPENYQEKTVPLKGTLKLRKKGQRIQLFFEAERNPLIKPITENSQTNAVPYFVSKDHFRNFGGAVIVDEVDEATGLNSVEYRSIFYLSRQAGLRIGGTGTPTSGYPETTMALLGLISDYSISTIANSMVEIQNNFSVYSLTDKNPVAFLVASIYTQLSGNDRDDFLWSIISLSQSGIDSLVAQGFFSTVERYVEKTGDYSLEGVLERIKALMSREEVARQVYKLIGELTKKLKSKGYDVQEGKQIPPAIFKQAFMESSFVRRSAGTFDPMGFVSALSGASFSLNTRENLKSEARGVKVEEKKNFDVETMEEIAEAVRNRGFLGAISPEDTEEFFAENTSYLREFADLSLPPFMRDLMLSDVYSFIIKNAEVLYRHYLSHPEAISEMTGIEPKKVKSLLSARKKQTSDSVLDYLKEYLYSNFRLDKDVPEEKRAVFEAFLSKLGEFLSVVQRANPKEEAEAFVEFEGHKITPALWKLPADDNKQVPVVFYRDGKFLLRKGDGAYPLSFSKNVSVSKEYWDALGSPVISFRFEYLNPSSYELLDILSNRGYERKIRALAREGKSFLITSPRVFGVLSGLYDALSALTERKEENTVHVLINAQNPAVYEEVQKLDRNALEKQGIKVKVFRDTVSLDAESQKIKRINLEKQARGEKPEQVIVASVDTAISRGVDLSHLDEMVVMGANTSGKTASQLFARLFSVDRDEADITVCGEPYRLRKGPNPEELRLYPSGAFYRTKNLLDKVAFIDQVVGGKLVNVLNREESSVELTSAGRKVLEQEAGLELSR